MKQFVRKNIRLVFFFILIASCFAVAKQPEPPKRLLFMVFDQMRPDYVDRFDLKNFKRLRKLGHEYREAYVGNSPAITVVSHVVMTTGRLSRDLPWGDNAYIDQTGILGPKNKIYSPENLEPEEFEKVLSQLPKETFLALAIKDKTKKKVLAFGEKDYATLGMGGPYADSITYLKNTKGVCKPYGVNVPEYISKDDRFNIDCKDDYGVKTGFIKIDGNRFLPGKDPKHLGGDVWVADAAIKALETEKDVGALFLTFGAIDRFAHNLGETDGPYPLSFEPPMHLKDIAKVADEQVGKLLDYLEKNKMLDSTMIVSTADHGGQTDRIYLGAGGIDEIDPFWISRLKNLSNIRYTTIDTSVRVWLDDESEENFKKAQSLLQEISKVTRIYRLTNKDGKYSYKEVYSTVKNESSKFQKWANAHDQELVDTQASDHAPHLIALFADEVGFGRLGDHGGNQEKSQRIPMFIVGPLPKEEVHRNTLRLMDISAIVRKAMQL